MNCYQKILQKNVYRACAGNCDEIASVTTFHRNDKFRVVIANVVWRSVSKQIASPRLRFAMTRTADKIRGQVRLQWQETCGRFPQKTNRWRFSSQ